MKRILSLALALLGGALAAENLLPDGDFLFGTASYMLGDNGNYVPVPHRVVPSGDAHGNILEISPESGRISALYLPEVPFRRGCEYELSFRQSFRVTLKRQSRAQKPKRGSLPPTLFWAMKAICQAPALRLPTGWHLLWVVTDISIP